MRAAKKKDKKIPGKVFAEWQEAVQNIAFFLNVSLVLIMEANKNRGKIVASNISVKDIKSNSDPENNPLHLGQKIMDEGEPLKISFSARPVKLETEKGQEMVLKSALGFPVHWPDGEIFGSLSVFSSGENGQGEKTEKGLAQFKDFFEKNLEMICLDKKLKEQTRKRKELKKSLKKRQKDYQETVNSISDGVLEFDEEGNIIFANQAAGNILEEKKDDLIGENLEGFFKFTLVQNKINASIENSLLGRKELEYKIITKTGKERILKLTLAPGERSFSEGRFLFFRDITESKNQGRRMKYLSFHYTLTNLYNRAFLEEEYKRLDVKRQMPTCLLIADLNGLKLINDSFGFRKGDLALKKAAEILQKSCRREDIISRWGGDEFVILLPKTREDQVANLCSRIKMNCLATENEEFPISLSLGVAVKEKPGEGIHSLFQKAENRMLENKLLENRSVKSHILKALLKTLAEKSSETEGHALRMQKMAYVIGGKMGLSQSDLDRLSLLAILHDLGKTIISEEILEKPGPLTPKEWKKIKQHPVTGFRIASATEEFMHIASLILYHHEWWDGSGYPSGIAGEEIPLLSRIISMVDAFDVMTTGRPYKKKMSREEATLELKRCAGTQFDPELVGNFAEVLQEVNFDL